MEPLSIEQRIELMYMACRIAGDRGDAPDPVPIYRDILGAVTELTTNRSTNAADSV